MMIGNYRFANLPTGTYLVEAHAIGHSTQIKNITVTEKAELDFSLGLQYTEESPVVITGISKATQIKTKPGSDCNDESCSYRRESEYKYY